MASVDAMPLSSGHRTDARAGLRTVCTAVGFMVGSTLFAVGVPLSRSADLADSAGWVFFAGSIFFTTAAFLQMITSRTTMLAEPAGHASWLRRRLHSRDLDWTASAAQLIGTVFFNVNTWRAATLTDPTVSEVNRLVWTPDLIGSVLFLVSSALAFAPGVRARRHGHVRDRSWLIGASNMLGSVFFGLSAVGALTLPSTGSAFNEQWADLGTFLGALCFLVGAALLLPHRRDRSTRTSHRHTQRASAR
jgi:hypothetical protein